MGAYTTAFPGYTIGENAYDKIGEICPRYGRKIIVIGGKTALSKVKETLIDSVAGSDMEIVGFLLFGGEASYENVERLKAMDTCKVLAHMVDKPFFTFPTIASNCACLTSLGVVYYPGGRF